MKVLFICSGNHGISPIIKAQGESIIKIGIHVDYVPIIGKGLWGYLKNIPKVRKKINDVNPDIIHAHYSLCGIVAVLARLRLQGKARVLIVTSLMGSDVKGSRFGLSIIRLFSQFVWSKTIVKSEDMKSSLRMNTAIVIPNGVDTDKFLSQNKAICRLKLGWDLDKKYILFAANPNRPEKNYDLAKRSFALSKLNNAELQVVFNVKHEDIPRYLCASDVLLSTSKWEGSPNIIKEAMACNVPIVSTNVGDVAWLAEGLDSMWVSEANECRIAKAIIEAIEFIGFPNSRNKLINMGLSSNHVANKLIGLYKQVI